MEDQQVTTPEAQPLPVKIVVEVVPVRRRQPPLCEAFLCFGALVMLSWLAEKLEA